MSKIKTSILITLLISGFFVFSKTAMADTSQNISGFAWSENIGWISFNNSSGGGTVNYGVNVDLITGIFSGYAWSDNIGWISFNSDAGCPSGICQAKLDLATKQVSGWAKVLSNNSWIRLRGTNYGVSWNDITGEMTGFAWSDTDIGWVSFNCINQSVCGTSNYKVRVNVSLDNTAPISVIRFTYGGAEDLGGSWHNTTTFSRWIEDNDNGGVGLDSCRYYLEESADAPRNCNSAINITVGQGKNCPSQNTTLTNSDCTLYVYAIDKAGNSADTKTGKYDWATYNIDWTSPSVGSVSPATATTRVTQTFFASVYDSLKVGWCWLYVDDIRKEPGATISPSPCINGQSCTVSATHVFSTAGNHRAYFKCADHWNGTDYLNMGSSTTATIAVSDSGLSPVNCISGQSMGCTSSGGNVCTIFCQDGTWPDCTCSPIVVPPDPPPLPPEPPLGTCYKENPWVYFDRPIKTASMGGSLDYTVYVQNRIVGDACVAQSFSLTTSICPNNFNCTLNKNTLTISPGAIGSTFISIRPLSTKNSPQLYSFKVKATTTGSILEGEAEGYYGVQNLAPTAAISCCPEGCENDAGNCFAYRSAGFCLRNDSTDPNGQTDIITSTWVIRDSLGEERRYEFSGTSSWTANVPPGDYTAYLTVKDYSGAEDTTSESFSIYQDAVAEFNCSNNNINWRYPCWKGSPELPLTVVQGKTVYFEDDSTASKDATITSWSWEFLGGFPSTSNSSNTATTTFPTVKNSGTTTLTITDSEFRTSSITYPIRVVVPLPDWIEGTP